MDEYGLEYNVGDYFAYDFAKVWRCSQAESNHKVHEFFKSHHFAGGIEVIPGMVAVLPCLLPLGRELTTPLHAWNRFTTKFTSLEGTVRPCGSD